MPLTRSGPANMNPALSTPPKMMGIAPVAGRGISSPLSSMPPSPQMPIMDGRLNPQQQMAMQQSPTYNHPAMGIPKTTPMSMPSLGPQGANVNPGSSYEPPPPPGYEYFDMYDGQQHLGRGLRPIQQQVTLNGMGAYSGQQGLGNQAMSRQNPQNYSNPGLGYANPPVGNNPRTASAPSQNISARSGVIGGGGSTANNFNQIMQFLDNLRRMRGGG